MARDIKLLHPELQTKVAMFIRKAKSAGYTIIVSQSLRSKAEQDAIYAQGRTKPGQIVSNAPYPQSLHCWGVAADIAVVIDGKANWTASHYKILGPIGESCGLVWGGRWTSFPDLPHYQLPGYTWSALQKQYGAPQAYISTWKAPPKANTLTWEERAINEAVAANLIEAGKHKGIDPANKAFVVAVALNLKDELKK